MTEKTIGRIAWETFDQNFDPRCRGAHWDRGMHDVERMAFEAAASAVWDEAVRECIQECFHQEQLQVWSDEFLSDLAAVGHVNPDTSYDDVVDIHRRFQDFLKHTVVSRISSVKRCHERPEPVEGSVSAPTLQSTGMEDAQWGPSCMSCGALGEEREDGGVRYACGCRLRATGEIAEMCPEDHL